MNALRNEKSELEHKEDVAERWMWFGMFLVFVGVLLETVPEFIGTSGWFLSLAHRYGSSTVTVGLAIEFVVELIASKYKGRLKEINAALIAETQERAALAEQRAAEANERAEKERTARVAMLGELKGRTFTAAQMHKFVNAIRGKIPTLLVCMLAEDDEANSYGWDIIAALQTAGVAVTRMEYDKFPGGLSNSGLILYDFERCVDGNTLRQGFREVGQNMTYFTPDKPLSNELPAPALFVGRKQRPFISFPEYAFPEANFPKPPWDAE